MDTRFIGQPHEWDPRRLYSQTGADWQHRVDFDRLRKERLEKLRASMKAHDLGALALFQIESGIIASWFQNCGDENPTELFPFHWDVVGQPAARVVMGKGSGIDSVKAGLTSLGVTFSEEDAMRVVAAVKNFSLQHKRLLTDAEFRDVVGATLPNHIVGAGKSIKTAV